MYSGSVLLVKKCGSQVLPEKCQRLKISKHVKHDSTGATANIREDYMYIGLSRNSVDPASRLFECLVVCITSLPLRASSTSNVCLKLMAVTEDGEVARQAHTGKCPVQITRECALCPLAVVGRSFARAKTTRPTDASHFPFQF